MTVNELFDKYANEWQLLGGKEMCLLDRQDFTEAIAEAIESGQLQPQVSQPGSEVGCGPKNAEGLIPCPFCGSYDVEWQYERHSVVCLTCDTFGPAFRDNKERAEEAWNKRWGRF